MSPLSNGNYIVSSPAWNGARGAATWGNGSTGVRGVVSAANSLVGSNPNDHVGGDPSNVPFITLLSNGNYVVLSPYWNGARGAVTWGNANTGVSGTVSAANSLVGSSPNDHVGSVAPLTNGNYVVSSAAWNSFHGAVTWGSGTAGVTGAVSPANSLVGSTLYDEVGAVVEPLSNGNYVVSSPNWDEARGAATWGNGSTGIHGAVSVANSLVGSSPNDYVGGQPFGYGHITALSNGNFVVGSPYWNGGRGAATWGNGSTGVSGIVSADNSLVGSNPGDEMGAAIVLLKNNNYLVNNPNWNGQRGAVTWGNGSSGVSGVVSAENSLVGSNTYDKVGYYGITVLSNGNYVVRSPFWNNSRGAATWGNGDTGVSGAISVANSLVGSDPGEAISSFGIYALKNGNYVVSSPYSYGTRGAVTWGNGSTGVTGIVSAANSLVGSNSGDHLGLGLPFEGAIISFSDGNYIVNSPDWNSKRGAATWVNGATGQTLDGNSTVGPQNSLVGTAANAGLSATNEGSPGQTYLAAFTSEPAGRVAVGLEDPNELGYSLAPDKTLTIAPNVLTATLNTGTAVVLQASNDITINSPITVRAGGQGGALTLQAGRSILLNARITTDNGDLTLIANDSSANGVVDADRDPGAAVVRMADGTRLDAGTGAVTVALGDGTGLTNSDSGAITLQTITAGSLAVANDGLSPGSDVTVGPVTTSGPQDYSNPNGTTQVTGNLTTTDSPVTFHDAVALDAGLTLGVGAGAVTFAGGTVPSPGIVHVRGSVALTDSATYSATLNDTGRSDYARLLASGPIDLGGATLAVVLGFEPPVGRAFKILTTPAAGGIQGTFAGLPEGAVFDHAGFQFQISYQGGANGRSVVLTRIA